MKLKQSSWLKWLCLVIGAETFTKYYHTRQQHRFVNSCLSRPLFNCRTISISREYPCRLCKYVSLHLRTHTHAQLSHWQAVVAGTDLINRFVASGFQRSLAVDVDQSYNVGFLVTLFNTSSYHQCQCSAWLLAPRCVCSFVTNKL